MKPTLDTYIERIEAVLFDQDEPGIRDTEWGDLCLTEIGNIRLKRILGEIQSNARKSMAPVKPRRPVKRG
jgi:hypothetical protein